MREEFYDFDILIDTNVLAYCRVAHNIALKDYKYRLGCLTGIKALYLNSSHNGFFFVHKNSVSKVWAFKFQARSTLKNGISIIYYLFLTAYNINLGHPSSSNKGVAVVLFSASSQGHEGDGGVDVVQVVGAGVDVQPGLLVGRCS